MIVGERIECDAVEESLIRDCFELNETAQRVLTNDTLQFALRLSVKIQDQIVSLMNGKTAAISQ